MCRRLLFFLLVFLLPYHKVRAQTFENYLRSLNSFVAVAPESGQIMKSIDFPVNLFTGTPSINVPVYTVQGIDLAVPLSLSYVAAGGVKVDELAGETGLGWSLSLGGEITREVRGTPDEGGGSGNAGGLFNNPHTIQWYINEKFGAPFNLEEEERASRGEFDLEPDIYYFKFGNRSGKFLFNDQLNRFECLNQEPIKIEFSGGTATSFTIIDNDGTRYVFGHRVRTSSRPECVGMAVNMTYVPPMTTSWKISKIVNPDRTDSVMFEYTVDEYNFYSSGSSTKYQLQDGPGLNTPRPDLECFNNNKVSGAVALSKIYSAIDSIVVERQVTARLDLPNTYAISKILAYKRGGAIDHIFAFTYDYFTRNSFVGYNPATSINNKSLKLLSLTDFGNSVTNPSPLKWIFDYRPESLPGRLSYAQDFCGYANSNTENTLVPQQLLITPYGALNLPGADRAPDPAKMQAGMLSMITHPTGGTTSFTYEPNTTAMAVPYVSAPSITTVQQLVYSFKGPGEQFSGSLDSYKVSFTINQPPNPIVNLDNPEGGVIADLHVFPSVGSPGITTAIDMNKVYFHLSGPSGSSYQKSMNNVHLKNGTYTMKILNATKLNHVDLIDMIRNINFSITYKILDSTVTNHNYYCGGVRVKAITNSDPYSSIQNVKSYRYHDPESDSSWGVVMGPSVNFYYDYTHHQVTNPAATVNVFSYYLVRMGNCLIPGNNRSSTPVLYPKVIEESNSGNQIFRTEHYFKNYIPSYANVYPYVPPLDKEALRGKPLKVIDYRQTSPSTFIPTRIAAFKYDDDPLSIASGSSFIHWVPAIRSIPGGYSTASTAVIQGAPSVSASYVTLVHRLYTVADTTVECNDNGIPEFSKWSSYTYGDDSQQPLSVTRKDSKGNLMVEKYGYATDWTDPEFELPVPLAATLSVNNRISEPFGYKFFKDNNLVKRGFKYGRFTGSQLLIDSLRQAEYDYSLEREAYIREYDGYANPLTVEGRGNTFRKYIWRKEKNIALATCSMPKNGSFVFTSFEYPNEYSTVIEGSRSSSSAFSGSYAYNLNGSLIFNGFNPAGGIEAYAWLSQGSFAVNGITAVNTGRTKGGWTLYKAVVPSNTTVTVSGACTMDQLVIIPAGSTFEGNVFDAMNRLSAKVNGNMQTTFFEYDAYGRLRYIRDEKGNILKSNTYQYQITQ